TPALTGLRKPAVVELLRMIRTAPGILAAATIWPMLLGRRAQIKEAGLENAFLALTACLGASLAILGAAMLVLTPNSVYFASFLQPVIVAGACTLMARLAPEPNYLRLQSAVFIVLAAIGSIRAIGMTTWGAACAASFGYSDTIHRVQAELKGCP